MVLSSLTFGGGLLLGLASGLHCAGMCGPIAASLMFGFGPGQTRALAAAQAGRVLIYTLAGALAGGAAGAAVAGAHPAAGFLVLRVAAALSLGWIGFSLLGLAPSLAFADRLAAPLTQALAGLRARGALAAGMVWGFLPCGMVYGALFYAGLSGGARAGALVMLGFGLGTLPAVTASAMGLKGVRALAHAPGARIGVGLTLIAVAAASLAAPTAAARVFCLP